MLDTCYCSKTLLARQDANQLPHLGNKICIRTKLANVRDKKGETMSFVPVCPDEKGKSLLVSLHLSSTFLIPSFLQLNDEMRYIIP